MSEYFPEPKFFKSDYAKKSELKDAIGADRSKCAKKFDLGNLKLSVCKLDIGKLENVPTKLSNLKIKVDKLDVDQLVCVPVDLSKLSDVVKSRCY